MNKRILVITALFFINNPTFCMEDAEEAKALAQAQQARIESNRKLIDKLFPVTAQEESNLSPQLNELQQHIQTSSESDRQRIDNVASTINSTPQLPVPEPAPLTSTNTVRKRITVLTLAQKFAYEAAPKRIQQMCDQAEAHPYAATTLAFAASEACGCWCCPKFTDSFNLLALGWGLSTCYHNFMDKQKEL